MGGGKKVGPDEDLLDNNDAARGHEYLVDKE